MRDREVEITFAVAPPSVGPVWRLLRTGLTEWRGIPLDLRTRRRTVVHFYLRPGGPDQTRRVRVKERDGALAISLESKRLVRDGELVREKQETLEQGSIPVPDALALLSPGAPVISAFVKNQYRIRYRGAGVSFKATLDQMLPFRVDNPERTGPVFWHLEFEEIHDWDPAALLDSPYFRQRLSPWLVPLEIPKWQIALMGAPAGLKITSARALRAYLESRLDRGRALMLPALGE
jgi:hypothetical protein